MRVLKMLFQHFALQTIAEYYTYSPSIIYFVENTCKNDITFFKKNIYALSVPVY